MKRITNYLKNHSARVAKQTAIAAIVVSSLVITSTSVLAYGPARTTYTKESPADKVTFNSITNSDYGDERNFVLVKDAANTASGGWSDQVNVADGKEYLVRVLVHNNAADNLNLYAKNTRISASVPTTTGTSVTVAANVIADNADPKKVWDEAVLKSDKKFNIAYVAGSANYYTNAVPKGMKLADSIVTSAGAPVGYDKLDGNVRGCFQYSGIATFKVKVQGEKVADFNVTKKVRLHGTTEWKKSITAKAGEKVDYQIGYDNTGDVWQKDVVAKDKLPKNVTYDKGSTTLKNANNPTGNGMKYSDGVTQAGINIGNYAGKSNAYVRFTATLPKNDKLEICGTNKLINAALIDTEYGSKQDTAEVVVEKENCGPRECKPGIPEGDERCDEAVVVTELPTTGAAEMFGAILGIVSLAAAFSYWYISKKRVSDQIAFAASGQGTQESSPKLLTAVTESDPKDDKKSL